MVSKTLVLIEDSSKSGLGGGQRVSLDVLYALQDDFNSIIVIDHVKAFSGTTFIRRLKDLSFIKKIYRLPTSGAITVPGRSSFSMGFLETISYPLFFLLNSIAIFTIALGARRTGELTLFCATKKSYIESILAGFLAERTLFHIHSPSGAGFSSRTFVAVIKLLKPACIAVSAFCASTYAVPSIQVVYNGVKKIAADRRTNGMTRVAFVGTLTEWKGVSYLIDAARHLKNEPFQFEIFGDGALRGELQEKSFDLDKVLFRGFINDVRLELGLNVDILVLPSVAAESCPMAVLESFAAGRPVVVTNFGGQQELLRHGGGISVPPRDARAIADALIEINRNYDYYSREADQAHFNYDLSIFNQSIRTVVRNVDKKNLP